MTLNELVVNELIWNKEKIQVRVENEHIVSKIDRIEFLMNEFEDYVIEWFESDIGEYYGENIPIIIFHLRKGY